MHRVADLVADYLEGVGDRPVLPAVKPGEVRSVLPAAPPEAPEPLDTILDDYLRVIEPNLTHWNHPGFLAYFGTYTVDEKAGVVVHHVEGASFPNWIGTDQRREFTLSGRRLTLRTPPLRAA